MLKFRKRIIRVVALVLCAALSVAIPAAADLRIISTKQHEFTAELAAAYQQKQQLLQSNTHIAMVVPSVEPAYSAKLKSTLNKYGITADVYTWAQAEAAPNSVFDANKYRTLIYTEASGIPSSLIASVSSYSKNKGGLICIGGPAFTDLYTKSGTGYIKTGTMEGAYGTTSGNEEAGGIFMDCLCPAYQTFPITNAVSVASGGSQGILPETEYDIPESMFSSSPRPYGTGIMKNRMRRYIPLIEAYDKKGEVAGYLAYILMTQAHGDSNYYDGIWASFNTTDNDFLSGDLAVNAIACTAAYFELRTFFYGGGASEYTYFDGEAWTLGAETISRNAIFSGKDSISYEIKLTVNDAEGEVYEKKFTPSEYANSYTTPLGEETLFTQSWTPPENGDYTVTVELYGSGVLMDRLTHSVGVYVEKPESERRFVTYEGNDMYLDGQVWKCYGVNYMPSTGITLLGDDYEKWTSSSSFDIDVISKDLRRIKDIGFNAVSVLAYHNACTDNNNVITLLRLCESYGLKVFFSIREVSDPIYYSGKNLELIRDMITKTHIVGNDTVAGYDIAWETMPNTYEPSWCNSVGMRAFDADWNQWLTDNYGSVEAAEEAWGWKLQRTENGLAKGIDSNTRYYNSEAASDAIIAYNRWLWDWTSQIFGRVVDDIRSIDADHMIGARNGMYTGWPNGRLTDVGWEYGALASALDYMGPEGYGYYSNWDDDFETAVFSVAYSRFSCEKPLIWFEFGNNSWSGSNYDAESGRKTQAEYIANINRVLSESQSNGIFYWWYAGGYRMREASDCGIINPDGSDRESTKIIRAYAEEFKTGGMVKEAEVNAVPARDEYKFGVLNYYLESKSVFKQAMLDGKTFGLVNSAAQTTSLDTDTSRISGLSVGPMRNLNACIRKLWYRVDDGEWKAISNNGSIEVERDSVVYFKMSVVNNGSATWICRDNAGLPNEGISTGFETNSMIASFLITGASSYGGVYVDVNGYTFDIPQDVSRNELITVDGIAAVADESYQLVFRMSAEDLPKFGNKYNVKIIAK